MDRTNRCRRKEATPSDSQSERLVGPLRMNRCNCRYLKAITRRIATGRLQPSLVSSTGSLKLEGVRVEGGVASSANVTRRMICSKGKTASVKKQGAVAASTVVPPSSGASALVEEQLTCVSLLSRILEYSH